MSLEQIADKVIETDVLIIGGGIAGCPTAAKAADHGLKVTLIEKAKPERSGSAGQGIDHYGVFPARRCNEARAFATLGEISRAFSTEKGYLVTLTLFTSITTTRFGHWKSWRKWISP